MRTTPAQRSDARAITKAGLDNHLSGDWLLSLFDDFAEMEAELAALRRVEASEDIEAQRSPFRPAKWAWRVHRCRVPRADGPTGEPMPPAGHGATLVAALENFYAGKEWP